MTTTPNYGLKIAEGTDTVNLLTQCYPNFTDLDSILKSIELTGITSAVATKTGTVFQVVRTNTDLNVLKFVATANYAAGDTFTIDGVSVTATAVDGTALPAGAFVINQTVMALLNGTVLTVLVGGGNVGPIEAEDVEYDNTVSGLTATDVQAAVDEIQAEIDAIPSTVAASSVTYDNTVSGLTATDVQAAIDEIAASLAPEYSSAGLVPHANVTITAGGYYISNGICHVDITTNFTGSSISAGSIYVNGFPPAVTAGASPNYYIGTAMNDQSMAYQAAATNAQLKVSANITTGARRFIGQYATTITP